MFESKTVLTTSYGFVNASESNIQSKSQIFRFYDYFLFHTMLCIIICCIASNTLQVDYRIIFIRHLLVSFPPAGWYDPVQKHYYKNDYWYSNQY